MRIFKVLKNIYKISLNPRTNIPKGCFLGFEGEPNVLINILRFLLKPKVYCIETAQASMLTRITTCDLKEGINCSCCQTKETILSYKQTHSEIHMWNTKDSGALIHVCHNEHYAKGKKAGRLFSLFFLRKPYPL